MRRVPARVLPRALGLRAALASVALAFATTLAACGGAGGDGGLAARALFWGIPFVPSSGDHSLVVGMRNLENDGATVTLQGYKPDGTPYSGPFFVELDGLDEAHVSTPTALLGDTPEGGWILATTPSRGVEVFFHVDDPPEAETSRASQLADLGAPPPLNVSGLTIHFQTDLIQISNASAVANLITVTPFEEPGGDPGLPPIEHPPIPVPFAAFETRVFDPDGLSGITGFVGNFLFEAPLPFFVAAAEDFLAFDVQNDVVVRQSKMPSRVTADVALRFGVEVGPIVNNYFDFVLMARNDSDEAQTLTVESIHDSIGTPILLTPRVLSLDPHETRVEATDGLLFDDVLGDVFLFPGLLHLHVRVTHAPEVNASFRQFDPAALAYTMTLKAVPEGHVFDVADLQGTFPDLIDVIDVTNPNDVGISVDVSVLIPEPEGFDASPLLLDTVFVPARSIQTVVVDGTFFNRDLEAVPFVGYRFTSLSPFGTTAYRERRSGADLIVYLTPRLAANHEVAGDY